MVKGILTRANQAASPIEALASENTLEPVALVAVGTKQEANLATGHANISSRDVGVGADVSAELGHEGVAEAADFAVAHFLGVDISTALGTTDYDENG